jgi:acyl-CoA thioester hydrolase
MSDSKKPALLAEYSSVIRIHVQLGDMDSFAHVNNAVYIRWLESSRVQYLADSQLSELMEATGTGPILASIHCDYKRQLRHPDNVQIGARMVKLGGTSMRVEHAVYSESQDAIVALGKSGVVYYDYTNQKPVPIPDDARARICKLEGREL